MQIVKVSFAPNGVDEQGKANWDSRKYDYFMADESMKIEKGDLAIVQAAGFLQVVKVTGFSRVAGCATKYLLASFSMEGVEQKIELRKAKEELLGAISQRMEQAMFLAQASKLADQDPELAKMLNALKDLG